MLASGIYTGIFLWCTEAGCEYKVAMRLRVDICLGKVFLLPSQCLELFSSYSALTVSSLCPHAGKSNLMDAISFVLGERTQNLRVRNLKVGKF